MNQYRLVFLRYHYSEGPDCVPEGERQLETFTKWKHWNGEPIVTVGANKIEFRKKV